MPVALGCETYLSFKQGRTSPQYLPKYFWPDWQSQWNLERSTSDEQNTATTRERSQSGLKSRTNEQNKRKTLLSQWTELECYLGVIELHAADARAGFTRTAGSLVSSPESSAHIRPSSDTTDPNLNLAPVTTLSLSASLHAAAVAASAKRSSHHRAHNEWEGLNERSRTAGHGVNDTENSRRRDRKREEHADSPNLYLSASMLALPVDHDNGNRTNGRDVITTTTTDTESARGAEREIACTEVKDDIEREEDMTTKTETSAMAITGGNAEVPAPGGVPNTTEVSNSDLLHLFFLDKRPAWTLVHIQNLQAYKRTKPTFFSSHYWRAPLKEINGVPASQLITLGPGDVIVVSGATALRARAEHESYSSRVPMGGICNPWVIHTHGYFFTQSLTWIPMGKTLMGNLDPRIRVLQVFPRIRIHPRMNSCSALLRAMAPPGGGYPATNKQGQRIWRQFGMPGRYKEGNVLRDGERWTVPLRLKFDVRLRLHMPRASQCTNNTLVEVTMVRWGAELDIDAEIASALPAKSGGLGLHVPRRPHGGGSIRNTALNGSRPPKDKLPNSITLNPTTHSTQPAPHIIGVVSGPGESVAPKCTRIDEGMDLDAEAAI
ncbi:hypothetical protein BD410DRAFT_802721 [Rickenella mellea]|uniref:Uncharacterized protein n=1 Tax=Rickenella mellea TaxID=50990 RepID=A0A4Y7Q7E0_9AGAM|nr:hypothetical protein BD410DRAFT_802721 [Rickenella mellea]